MTHDYEDEEWRGVEGYEGFYEVSSFGRVRSLERIIEKKDGTKQPVKPRVLSQYKTGKTENPKYYGVQLTRNGKSRSKYVHRLVARAFLGERPDGLVTNHINGDSFCNLSSNLEYITNRENVNHGKNNQYAGVSYYRKTNKWRASILVGGKNISLGLHDTPEEAHQAYLNKLEELGETNKYAFKAMAAKLLEEVENE